MNPSIVTRIQQALATWLGLPLAPTRARRRLVLPRQTEGFGLWGRQPRFALVPVRSRDRRA